MTSQETITALQSRYAVKKFDTKATLTEEQYALIKETLHLTPSSFGLEPWKFFIVTDKSIRKEFEPYAMKNTQVIDASALIVMCAKDTLTKKDVDDYIMHTAQVRGILAENLAGFKKVLHGFRIGKIMNTWLFGIPQFFASLTGLGKSWAESQVYIALGNLMTVCAMHGIDTCPMGGFHQRGFKKVLSKHVDTKGYTPVVLCAVGTRAADDVFATMKKVRKDIQDVIVRM